jgi:hypothetical protein
MLDYRNRQSLAACKGADRAPASILDEDHKTLKDRRGGRLQNS